MATRAQVKATLDSFNATVKADIDNTLPAGVNIVGGDLNPVAGTWQLKMLATDSASATATLNAMVSALAAQSRAATVRRHGRREIDTLGNHIFIVTATGSYEITYPGAA